MKNNKKDSAKQLCVCQVASEMVPFAKTGGLADVVGALTAELKKNKVEVCAFMPLYKQVKETVPNLVSTNVEVKVKIGDNIVSGRVWKTTTPDKVDVYFIQRDEYFNRDYLYSTPEGDYLDNAERFIFFSRAVLEAMKALGIKCNVVHCHDWQSALIPVYLKTLYKKDQYFSGIKTLLTVHNLAYQGVFWHWDLKLTGFGWELFNYKQLEFFGKLNFLKGGLVFADKLTTVSPRYSKEIQTVQFGESLDGVLRERSADLTGIINGVDYSQWSPDADKLIPATYTAAKIANKLKNKRALQQKGLLPESDLPLIGMIGRLADQKGFDILVEVFDKIIQAGCQFILLGTGEEKYHKLFAEIAKKYQGKASINITFNNALAHTITAGVDMFLMPSRYEPCGLNQLYSLKYGTIPIVHETGGLADTIYNYTPEALKEKKATGFTFKNYSSGELLNVTLRALELYKDKKSWQQLIKNAMAQDWSWKRSSQEYINLYSALTGK